MENLTGPTAISLEHRFQIEHPNAEWNCMDRAEFAIREARKRGLEAEPVYKYVEKKKAWHKYVLVNKRKMLDVE